VHASKHAGHSEENEKKILELRWKYLLMLVLFVFVFVLEFEVDSELNCLKL